MDSTRQQNLLLLTAKQIYTSLHRCRNRGGGLWGLQPPPPPPPQCFMFKQLAPPPQYYVLRNFCHAHAQKTRDHCNTGSIVGTCQRDGGKPFLCFYDIEKAFDSVEIPILLKQLYFIGINGKLWRLLKHWYSTSSEESE